MRLRLRLYGRLCTLALRLQHAVRNGDREQAAQVFREVEDTHRDLGHDFYDWRTHGGTLADFTNRRRA